MHSGVVLFGDSIFGRWDVESYFPAATYHNGGMFGFRTDQLLPLLPDVLSGKKVCHGLAGDAEFPLECSSLPHPPATVVILAGWNNLFQARPDGALADLQAMVDQALASGSNVIICTLYRYDSAHPAPWMGNFDPFSNPFPYDTWLLPLNDGIRKMARQNVTVVDLDALFYGQSDYTLDPPEGLDGIHPNARGYEQMHDALAAVLGPD